jgi:hypothetical protein
LSRSDRSDHGDGTGDDRRWRALVLVSLFADPLCLGRHPDFGWLQEAGVIIGILAITAGFYLRGRAPRRQVKPAALLRERMN